MMNQEETWRQFIALPLEAQRQAADFIVFLQTRYQRPHARKKAGTVTDLSHEPFIGMWRERGDMKDSRDWVRNIRETEWAKTHE